MKFPFHSEWPESAVSIELEVEVVATSATDDRWAIKKYTGRYRFKYADGFVGEWREPIK